MDHGLLNVPLAKRCGDIDAQLDRYKAQQAAQRRDKAKADRAQLLTDRAAATEILERMPPEQLQRIADKAGVTPTNARKQLASMAFWTPKRVLALRSAA